MQGNYDPILAPDRSYILVELLPTILDYSSTGQIRAWSGVSQAFLAKANLVDPYSRNLLFRVSRIFRDAIAALNPVANANLIANLRQIQSGLEHQHFPDLRSFKRYALPIANQFIDALSQDPSIFSSELEEPLTQITISMNCFKNVLPVATLRRTVDSTLVDETIHEGTREILLSSLIDNLVEPETAEGRHQAIEFVSALSDTRVQSHYLKIFLAEIVKQIKKATSTLGRQRYNFQILSADVQFFDLESLLKNYARLIEIAATIEDPDYRSLIVSEILEQQRSFPLIADHFQSDREVMRTLIKIVDDLLLMGAANQVIQGSAETKEAIISSTYNALMAAMDVLCGFPNEALEYFDASALCFRFYPRVFSEYAALKVAKFEECFRISQERFQSIGMIINEDLIMRIKHCLYMMNPFLNFIHDIRTDRLPIEGKNRVLSTIYNAITHVRQDFEALPPGEERNDFLNGINRFLARNFPEGIYEYI